MNTTSRVPLAVFLSKRYPNAWGAAKTERRKQEVLKRSLSFAQRVVLYYSHCREVAGYNAIVLTAILSFLGAGMVVNIWIRGENAHLFPHVLFPALILFFIPFWLSINHPTPLPLPQWNITSDRKNKSEQGFDLDQSWKPEIVLTIIKTIISRYPTVSFRVHELVTKPGEHFHHHCFLEVVGEGVHNVFLAEWEYADERDLKTFASSKEEPSGATPFPYALSARVLAHAELGILSARKWDKI